MKPEQLLLPWGPERGGAAIVGELARNHGWQVPMRLVSSAKSWLSHAGVDRLSAILPWQSPAEVAKVSPVEAVGALPGAHPRRRGITRIPTRRSPSRTCS